MFGSRARFGLLIKVPEFCTTHSTILRYVIPCSITTSCVQSNVSNSLRFLTSLLKSTALSTTHCATSQSSRSVVASYSVSIRCSTQGPTMPWGNTSRSFFYPVWEHGS
uniref:Uncharacterized protein n=1 Tax=Cacopsylla melanoneura TaxID=428564 RepID=A0A8D8ZE22_9HEMI